MKARPILFSGPMVRAILAGTKTQTRRVMKPQPRPGVKADRCATAAATWGGLGPLYHVWEPKAGETIPLTSDCAYRWLQWCPYGQVAERDRLWVRETLQPDQHGADYVADGALALEILSASTTDEQVEWWNRRAGDDPMTAPAVPSIFMPRWASRLTLEVTGVRIQRLQHLSEDDAQAEGVIEPKPIMGTRGYVAAFSYLWDSINGERPGCDWVANPWVWAISFRRLE